MLIGLDPLLGPELLFTLRSMGHGDDIAIVDGNYPAEAHATRLVRCDGHGVAAVLDAILSVMPVDTGVPQAMVRAVNANTPDRPDPVHEAMHAICRARVPGHDCEPLEPAKFYARVKTAHTVVATSEPQLYGNIILRKGVIRPA